MPKIIPTISSLQKTLGQKLATNKISACSDVSRQAVDGFERKSNSIINNNDYLADVVYEKTGLIFHKAKATFQGKPIATTKSELIEQLSSYNYDSEYITNIGQMTKSFINESVSKLKKGDIATISRISKFFHEINTPENKYFEKIKQKVLFNKETLPMTDKLLTHSRHFNTEEVSEILASTSGDKSKYLDVLLKTDPSKLENNLIGPCMTKIKFIDAIELQKQINRIKDKLETVEDEKIKEFVNSYIFKPNPKRIEIAKNYFISKDGENCLDKAEMLLDAYHCENNHYSMLNGETQEYYNYLKKEANPDLAKEISTEIQKNPEKRTKLYAYPIAETQAELFNEAVRLEPLKNFIGKYFKSEPDMTNYLYEKYFLPKIPDFKIKDTYQKINKEFGTKVFVENNESIMVGDKINSELKDWANASKSQAKFPSIIDLSQAKKNFVEQGEIITQAYFKPTNNSINMPTNSFMTLKSKNIIRHEMAHLNDPELAKTGIINGIDMDEIIKNRKFESELKAAGINDFGVDYAYTDKRELIAVAATGDYTKYSQKFKDTLIKLGMPEWVFELKSLYNSNLEVKKIPDNLAQKLEDGFINLAIFGKDGKYDSIFPNGIMIEGQDVNLNDVAEWLAKKSDCKLEKVDFTNISIETAMKELLNISNRAKENNERTIIQIENFERFTIPTDENRRIIGALKSFLSGCAQDKKCTIIAQTKDSSKIDDIVMADHRFQIQIKTND